MKDNDRAIKKFVITTNYAIVGIGYYAKDVNGNLYQYEWGAGDEFYIMNSNGDMVMDDPSKYEILEVGYFTSE